MTVIRSPPPGANQRLTEPEEIHLRFFFSQIYRVNFGLSTNSYATQSDMFVRRFGRTLESAAVRYAAIACAALMLNRKPEETTRAYLGRTYAYIREAITERLYPDALYASYILFRCTSNIRLYDRDGNEALHHAHGLWNCCKELRNSASAMNDDEYYLMESLCINVFRWLYGFVDRDSRPSDACSGFKQMAEIVHATFFILDLDAANFPTESLFNRAQLLVLYMEIYFEYYVHTLNCSAGNCNKEHIESSGSFLQNILCRVIQVIPKISLAKEVHDQGFLILRESSNRSTMSHHEPKSFHYMVRSVWELVMRYYSAVLLKAILFEDPSPAQKKTMAWTATKICDLASTALDSVGDPMETYAVEKSIIYASRSVFLAGIAFIALNKHDGTPHFLSTLIEKASRRATMIIDEIRMSTPLGLEGVRERRSAATVETSVPSLDTWSSNDCRDFLMHTFNGVGFLDIYSQFPRCERVWWWSAAGHLLR